MEFIDHKFNLKLAQILKIFTPFLLIFITLSFSREHQPKYNIYQINRGDLFKKKLIKFDIIAYDNSYVFLRLSEGEKRDLESMGVLTKMVDPKFYQLKYSTESSYDDKISELERLTSNDFSKLVSLGKSWEDREIYGVRMSLSDSEWNSNFPDAIIVGLQHAREWTTMKVIFLLIEYFADNYKNHKEIEELLNRCEIWYIPILNPDGFEYSREYDRLWRKNRRDNQNGSYGADLNRNFDFEFYHENRVIDTTSPLYSGPLPFSEPESTLLKDLIQRVEIGGVLDLHAYSELILYPWAYTTESTADEELFNSLSLFFQESILSLYGEKYQYGQPSEMMLDIGDGVGGSLIDYTYANYDVPSFAFELRPQASVVSGFDLEDEEIEKNFNEILESIILFLKVSCNHDWRSFIKNDLANAEEASGCGIF